MQIDHRVPYEVAGDAVASEADKPAFMLICGSCQRSKSWSCEHCDNFINLKNPDLCRTCYWGSPEKYEHIALTATRREVIIWTGEEVETYKKLAASSEAAGLSVAEYIRKSVEKALD